MSAHQHRLLEGSRLQSACVTTQQQTCRIHCNKRGSSLSLNRRAKRIVSLNPLALNGVVTHSVNVRLFGIDRHTAAIPTIDISGNKAVTTRAMFLIDPAESFVFFLFAERHENNVHLGSPIWFDLREFKQIKQRQEFFSHIN
ncbi:MAG: hypothetical protein ACR2IL_11625, partial [Chitinophagaceae bacterium]